MKKALSFPLTNECFTNQMSSIGVGFFGNLCIMMTTLYSVQAAQTVSIWRTVKTQHVLGQYYVTDFLYINHYDSQHKLHQTIKIQKFSTES